MAELVVALDLPATREALRIVDAIGDSVSWYKVGPVLHVSEGEQLLAALKARGKRVFLDLKWHDIPNTVAGAVIAASKAGIALATIHLLGGRRMIEAAVRARHGSPGELRLAGVGVLTSHTAMEFGDVLGRPLADAAEEQERLVRIGIDAGLDAFVSAVSEAPRVRAMAGPKAMLVTPGIRGPGEGAGDQARTATAAEAVRAGADLLVVGRPVTAAKDPAAAAAAILVETSRHSAPANR